MLEFPVLGLVATSTIITTTTIMDTATRFPNLTLTPKIGPRLAIQVQAWSAVIASLPIP